MRLILAALVYAAIWSIRFRYDHAGALNDSILITGFLAWNYRNLLRGSFEHQYQRLFHNEVWCLICFTTFNLLLWTSPSWLSWYRAIPWRNAWESGEAQHGLSKSSSPLKPLIFPCRTTHTRLFPKKHSFSYSYLFVGVPVGRRSSVGSVLSADAESLARKDQAHKGWLSVESADYLGRGDHVNGLQGKLDSYLRSQVGHTHYRPHPKGLYNPTERGSSRLCLCLPDHCSSTSGLLIQSGLILVSLR